MSDARRRGRISRGLLWTSAESPGVDVARSQLQTLTATRRKGSSGGAIGAAADRAVAGSAGKRGPLAKAVERCPERRCSVIAAVRSRWLIFDLECSLRRLADGDWIGNKEPATLLPPTNMAAAATNKEPTPTSPPAGQLVTERFEYDGGRQVTAYVPPAAPEAIVFAGDGELITSWGGVLEAADLPPTMIIGAHRLDDETLRIHEYSPGESTTAFALTLNGSRRTRRSLSRTCADGRSRGSTSRCLPTELRCSVSRRVESSRSPWGFAIPTSTARSFARRRALATDRLP